MYIHISTSIPMRISIFMYGERYARAHLALLSALRL